MNKFLKLSLLVTAIFISTLIGSDKVNAASFVEFEDETGAIEITEFDMGDLTYGTSVTKTITLVNKSADAITLKDLKVTDIDRYEIVGTPATTIPAHSEITVDIKNVAGISVSSEPLVTKLSFYADNGVDSPEHIELPITGDIVPVKLPKVTVAGTYTFKPDVYGHGSKLEFAFNNYDNALMSMSGTTITYNAGDYTTIIMLADANNYSWDDGSKAPLHLDINVAKIDGTPTLPDNISVAGIGDRLGNIHLTHGWVWTNPDQLIEAGSNHYSITYAGGNYNGTFVNDNKDPITGVVRHKVNLPENPNVSTNPSSNMTILNGERATLMLYAKSGYEFTSIKVNGVEQITSKVSIYNLQLVNVRSEMFVEVETERNVAQLITPTEPSIFEIGSDKTLKFVFDLTMNFPMYSNAIINGEVLTYDETMENFNFTLGETFGVEIKNEYLKTLPVGTYDIEIDLATGQLVKTSFTVTEVIEPDVTDSVNPDPVNPDPVNPDPVNLDPVNPDTGDSDTGDNVMTYVILMFTSVIGFGLFSKFKNKKI